MWIKKDIFFDIHFVYNEIRKPKTGIIFLI